MTNTTDKDNFDAWFYENKDNLADCLRNDAEEALFQAWLSGYSAGLNQMGKFLKPTISYEDTRRRYDRG